MVCPVSCGLAPGVGAVSASVEVTVNSVEPANVGRVSGPISDFQVLGQSDFSDECPTICAPEQSACTFRIDEGESLGRR
jgi:hypothetical protein